MWSVSRVELGVYKAHRPGPSQSFTGLPAHNTHTKHEGLCEYSISGLVRCRSREVFNWPRYIIPLFSGLCHRAPLAPSRTLFLDFVAPPPRGSLSAILCRYDERFLSFPLVCPFKIVASSLLIRAGHSDASSIIAEIPRRRELKQCRSRNFKLLRSLYSLRAV